MLPFFLFQDLIAFSINIQFKDIKEQNKMEKDISVIW